MPIPLDALLALKAFQIGTAVAKSPQRREVLNLLEHAIGALGERKDPLGLNRCAFYLAIRAEMFRGEPLALNDRGLIRELCSASGSRFFDWFMKVQDVTESKTGDWMPGTTSSHGFEGATDRNPTNPFISPVGRAYRALGVLSIGTEGLSPSQRRFLEKVTLIQLLTKHGLTAC